MEPIKPKRRVTGQMSLASPQTPSLSTQSSSSSRTSTPTIRARIDPSISATPTSRPSLRSTQSVSTTPTSSIRASASLPSVPTRPRSPVRVKSPLLPESNLNGPVRARVRASSPAPGLVSPLNNSSDAEGNAGTPMGRVRARIGGNISVKGLPNIDPVSSPSTPTLSRSPSRSENRPKIAKAQTAPITQPARSRALSNVSTTAKYRPSASPLPSPIPAVPPISPVYLQTPGAGPSSTSTRQSISSPHSTRSISPQRPPPRIPTQLSTPTLLPKSLLAHIAQDPTASCPPSPHHSALPPPAVPGHQARTGLPEHPTSLRPPRPPLPESPEVRTVDLPELTPVSSAQERYGDDGGTRDVEGRVIGLGFESEAGIGASDDQGGSKQQFQAGLSTGDGKGPSVPGDIHEELATKDMVKEEEMVEEARINRKVADLEISNRSLLAVNRTLEITKSKQRAEILRLRRALRESLAHPHSNALPLVPISPSMETTDDPDETSSSLSAGEADLNLSARWTKLEEMITNMQKRAEVALNAVRDEPVKSGRAVLTWQDEDEEGSVGIGTPDRKKDGEG